MFRLLFGWLSQRLWQKRRQIFRFNDGSRVRAVDPIAIAVALKEHKEFLPRHLTGAVNGDPESRKKVADAACDVFGVVPFDGLKTGLTVAERIELMLAFDLWMLTVKKNFAFSQMSQTSTESTSTFSSEPTI